MNIKDYVNFKTLGYVILGYAGIAFLAAKTGIVPQADPNWYTQLILTIGSGLLSLFLDGQKFTIWGVLTKVYNYFTSTKVVQPVVTDDVFDALTEVTEALNKAGDVQGVAICKELNSHLFDAIYNKKVVADVKTV